MESDNKIIENNNKIEFNLEEELAKVIIANCLTGPFIRSGIRKKDGSLVLISSVKKNGENFYIPVLRIAEFLKKKFNEDNEFKNLEDLKRSFEKLLFDIDENERELIKGKDNVIYSVNGRRFLGIDGLCYYLGKRINNLPTFTLGKSTPEDNAFRDQWLISDKEAVKWIDRSLDRQFKLIDLYPDLKHEVDKYPIPTEEQEKVANQSINKKIKTIEKHGESFVNIIDENNEEYNTVGAIVNGMSKWKKGNLNFYEKGIAKYCSRCNFVKNNCNNENSYYVILNSSFEISDDLKSLNSNSEIKR